jgi:NitT/TauT family transport system ATP-binding protein
VPQQVTAMTLDIRIERKRFPDAGSGGQRLVLQDIRIALHPGEFLAVVGPSGCGKSTLLHIVAGLDPDFEGRITFPQPPGVDRPRLGYVFQNPRLLPWLTVRDNILLVLDQPSAHREKVDALLDAMGLGEFGRFHPNRLSVGMQRRAALARAFAVEPQLLLMDEPFVSLDQPTAYQLRTQLLEVWNTHRTTVIFVTHDLAEATMLADRILFLSSSPARVIGEAEVGIPRDQRSDAAAVSRRYQELKNLFDSLY